jgi:hypothetical protein
MWSSERGDVGVVSPFRETEVLPYQIPRYDDSDCEDSCDPSASLDRRPFRPLDSKHSPLTRVLLPPTDCGVQKLAHASRGLVILVDQTTESRSSMDAEIAHGSAVPPGGFWSREI